MMTKEQLDDHWQHVADALVDSGEDEELVQDDLRALRNAERAQAMARVLRFALGWHYSLEELASKVESGDLKIP